MNNVRTNRRKAAGEPKRRPGRKAAAAEVDDEVESDVDDDNDPLPENVPTEQEETNSSAGLKENQTWGFSGIDYRKAAGFFKSKPICSERCFKIFFLRLARLSVVTL